MGPLPLKLKTTEELELLGFLELFWSEIASQRATQRRRDAHAGEAPPGRQNSRLSSPALSGAFGDHATHGDDFPDDRKKQRVGSAFLQALASVGVK